MDTPERESLETQALETQPAAASPRFAWQSWPLRDAAPWSWAALPGLALSGFVAWLVTQRNVWAVLAPLALALSAWRFFLPLVYRLDRMGVHQQLFGRISTRPWYDVRACELRRQGAVLYDVDDPAAIDALRALFLPWGSHRDDVVSCLTHYLDRDRIRGDCPAEDTESDVEG